MTQVMIAFIPAVFWMLRTFVDDKFFALLTRHFELQFLHVPTALNLFGAAYHDVYRRSITMMQFLTLRQKESHQSHP